MLDKSLPYKDILMAMDPAAMAAIAAGEGAPDDGAPVGGDGAAPGYTLRLYRPGDAAHWAETEAQVGEFDSPQAALEYFGRVFLPHPEMLARRMVFACDEGGQPVANAAAWVEEAFPGFSLLHWVATRPAHQGQGLAGALVRRCIAIACRQQPGQPMLLHTQTWSHPAVRLYWKLGFRLVRGSGPVAGMKNDFDGALQVLQGVYPDELWRQMEESAVAWGA